MCLGIVQHLIPNRPNLAPDIPIKGSNFIHHGMTGDERANGPSRQHASFQDVTRTDAHTVARRVTLLKSVTWLAYFSVAPLCRFLIGPRVSVDAQVIHDVRATTDCQPVFR